MSWYNTQGPCPNYVLFSKVRYVRNIAKQSFCPTSDSKRRDETLSRLETILQKNGFRGEKVLSGVTPALLSLSEKQFVERDFVYSDKPRALYLNEPCNLLVALGGDNYISISSVVAGLSVSEAKNMASGAEEIIDGEIAFAYAENIGYLSPDICACGSGISFSALLYLPSVRLLNNERNYTHFLRGSMQLSPAFLHEGNPGDLYLLKYTPHYLCDESSAAAYFENTVAAIADYEKNKLISAFRDSQKELYSRARRAHGALLYSDPITESEMLNNLSQIRLSHCISPETSNPLPPVTALNFLSSEGLNCSVIASSKEPCTSQGECDSARSRFIVSYIEHKNEVI
ncbi:MAG: hypothetical protein ACI3X1_06860 [Eubacteriales bacterium]